MHHSTQWRKLIKDLRGQVPLKKDELHVVVQGQVYRYQNQALPEPLHPVAMEFGKSASDELLLNDRKFKTRLDNTTAAQHEEDMYLYKHVIDPDKGVKIELLGAQRTYGGGDNKRVAHVHEFEITGDPKPIATETIVADWHPFKEATEINGQVRQPIMNYLSCADQVTCLLKAFGPEVVDYSFRGTPFWELLPEETQGSFDRYTAKNRSKPEGSWLKYHFDRCISEQRAVESTMATTKDIAKADNTAYRGQSLNLDVESVDSVLETMQQSGSLPGGVDKEAAKRILAELAKEKLG